MVIDPGFVAAGPKTSEFAFYKKLKEDAGQRFECHSIHGEKNQSNKLDSSKGAKELLGNVSTSLEGTGIANRNISSNELGSLCSIEDVRSKDSKLSFAINGVAHIDFDSFNLPVDKAVNNSEVSLNKAFWAFESPCCIECWLEHDSDSKRLRGSKSDQVELFSRKRQKLRQWAHNSLPEIEDLCAKGYNLVSMLLSQLLPSSNEKKSFRSLDSTPVESNSNSELFACSKSDIPAKEHCGMLTRNIMETEYMPYLENGTLSCCSDRLSETMLSNFGSPTKNYCSTLQKNLELPINEVGGENLMPCIGGDSTFGSSFVRHGSYLPFIFFKEPDDSHDLRGSFPGREPHVLLVEWNSANMNERSSSATCQNTNWTMIPAVQSPWDHWQSSNNWSESYGTLGVSSSPVLSNHPQESHTLMSPISMNYEKNELGSSTLDEEEEIIADLSRIPLTLSHSLECLNQNRNCAYYDIACRDNETSDILPFLGNQLGFMNKVFGKENSTPSVGTHLFFFLGVEWKWLQSTRLRRKRYSSTCNDLQFPEKEIMYSNFIREDGFESSSGGSDCGSLIQSSEDILDMPDWQSFCFLMFHDKDKAYPLLLDKSSWEDYTEETRW